MKFIHVADIHADRTRYEQVVQILNTLIKRVQKKDIDAVLFCGDFWNSTITNTHSSGFDIIVGTMKKLCEEVDVLMIYGTPSHEPDGSLEIFKAIGARVMDGDKSTMTSIANNTVNVLCIPEPRRSNFVSKSTESTDKKINQYYHDVLQVKSDKPLVIAFHGEVNGAVYQNGVKASAATQLKRSDIENTKALYIACGHIHSPQEVFKNCVYVGSAIPVDMGETHDGSYNLVTIENNKATYETVSFGMPINKTIELDYNVIKDIKEHNYSNVNLKIKLKVTPEERKLIKLEQLKNEIQAKLKTNSIQIVLVTSNDITVRSKEIISQKTISEKLETYAKVNSIELTDSILDKAKNLEDNLLIQYAYPTHSFELISLSLRGAIGLTGREEIFIDFSNYDNGIVALLGENGKGKTTIIENCHPYPCMLTRSGALKTHFYLPDSHRILVYKDENNKYYRITIQIAAHIKTGLTKYYVETSNDGLLWNPIKDCDGNLDSYNTYINETFGTIDIFLRTSFFAKEQTKGIPDIASATKSERMNLFSKLIGTDNLNALHDMAKEKIKELKLNIDSFGDPADEKSKLKSNISMFKSVIKDSEVDIENSKSLIGDYEHNLFMLRKDQEYYIKNKAIVDSQKSTIKQLEFTLNIHNQKLNELNQSKAKNTFFTENKKFVDDYIKCTSKADDMNTKLSKYLEEEKHITDSNTEIISEKSKIELNISKLDSKLEILISNQKTLEATENHDESTCPLCGSSLTGKKKTEMRHYFADNKRKLDEVISEIEQVKTTKVTLENQLDEITKKEAEITKKRNQIKYKISILKKDITDNQIQIGCLSEYADYVGYTPIENIDSQIEQIQNQINQCTEQLKNQSETKLLYEDKSSDIKNIETKKKLEEENLLKVTSEKTFAEVNLKQSTEKLSAILDDEEKIKDLQKEMSEYELLSSAFSNTGIQALELEAAAPDIALIANQILRDSYGDKFTISFKTLHQGKSKLIEDFGIDVTNNETGRTAPIEFLSSGEKVWIKQALYYAFSLIRMEKTGFNFKVRFIDESDGSLDSEMRLKYINMVKSAHNAGNSRLTVIITHSQEIKDIVTQTINL